MELCQLDKVYLYHLTKYNKILNQRNKLLKDINFKPELKDTLSVWDMQLIDYGRKIIESRHRFIEELNGIVKNIHRNISGNKEELIILYETNVEEEFLEQELKKNQQMICVLLSMRLIYVNMVHKDSKEAARFL